MFSDTKKKEGKFRAAACLLGTAEMASLLVHSFYCRYFVGLFAVQYTFP